MIHLKGLNGFRAIASMMVVYAHISHEYSDTYKMAGHYVSMFFVLSGFLITFLLLKEKEKSEVDVRKFYIRRVLRIWPLYFLYFAVCLFVLILMNSDFQLKYSAFYILMMANVPYVLGVGLPLMAHYWSLGTEEQFYLFFPMLAKKTWLLNFAYLFIIIFIIIKIILWFVRVQYNFPLGFSVMRTFQFDSMMIGAAGAVLFANGKIKAWVTNPISQILSWLIIGLVIFNLYKVHPVIDSEIIAIVTLILIIGQVKGKGLIKLENKMMNFIGRISYGIYVIHPLVIYLLATKNQFLTYITVFGVTIILAKLSFELFERKFLKMKTRYEVINSRG